MADLLIVDDDSDTAQALADVLSFVGHDVRIALNGREGLDRLDERLPDLVLLDVEMPILGGPEMAERMFVLDLGRENIPLILLSGVPYLRQIAGEIGTPYALAKPIAFEDLNEVIERALRERVAPRATPA